MSDGRITETRTCASHGEYEAYNYFRGHWNGCPKCDQERKERQRREYEEELDRQRHQNRLKASGIEGRFLRARFSSFEATTPAQRKALTAVQEYGHAFTRDTKSTLWLIGPPGTGKTHLGAALVHEVIEQHKLWARIITPRQIVRQLRATWRRESEQTEEEVIDDLASDALLVLDEVGVSFGSDGELVQLFDVLDARYRRERPTLVISNLPHTAIKEALGDRLYDRLREGARVLPCDWPSYRGRAAT
jgi:DNA replication protein DnaC